MKTTQEVIEYIQGKKYPLFDLITIQGYLHAKGIEEEFNIGEGKLFLAKDFIEWFESETKEDNKSKAYNQNVIEFEGKPYEFIEGLLGECCCYCDLHVNNECLYNPIYCTEYNRLDKREGYFKLKKEQPKEVKLIEGEFYSYKEPNRKIWIYQYRKWKTKTSHFFSLNTSNDNLYELGSVDGEKGKGLIKIATPEEKQQLINAVEKQENKHWNESTKTFEDKPKDILVPENIKIIKYQNNQLGLVFNDNKQVLTFSEGVYIVQPLDKLDKFISCRLEETIFEELEVGEMFFQRENPCDDTLDEIIFYSIKKDKQNYVYISDTDVNVLEIDSQIVYKLIPIK